MKFFEKNVLFWRDIRSVEYVFVFRRVIFGLLSLLMNAIALYERNPSTFVTEGHLKLLSY